MPPHRPPRIIERRAEEAHLPDDRSILIDDIRALLALKPGDAAIDRLEETLTAGYAHALALEAEQWRLERRLGQAAREVGDAEELARVAQLLAAVEGELGHLRALLGSLRDRARKLRAAPAPL
jgi:hypothetical protein